MIQHFYQYTNKKFEYFYLESKLERSILTPIKNLVFLHGINDSVQNHFEFFEELASMGYNVYAFNLPLHGKSDNLSNLTWNSLSDLVNSFIKDTNIANLTVAGYSLGGAVLLNSLNKLQNLEKIVLISPYCYPLKYFSIEFLLGAFRFSVRNVYELFFKNNKKNPYNENIWNIFFAYKDLFTQEIDFNKEDINVKISLIILGKDEIIRLKGVQQRFKEFNNINISVLDNFSHNIYYITKDQQTVLCKLIAD